MEDVCFCRDKKGVCGNIVQTASDQGIKLIIICGSFNHGELRPVADTYSIYVALSMIT